MAPPDFLCHAIVASALCIKARGLLTSAQAEKVDRLKAASAEFTVMRALAMRFRGLLRCGDIELPDTWLSDAVNSGIHAIRQFAATLRRDLVAVRNAILQPWSSGPTEGQINRLKRSSVRCMDVLAPSYSALVCSRSTPPEITRGMGTAE
jgi:transposase